MEKYKYVLEKDYPLIPIENAPSAELLGYANWLDLNKITRCYMMVSMSSVLPKQNKGYKTASEIMHNVEDNLCWSEKWLSAIL